MKKAAVLFLQFLMFVFMGVIVSFGQARTISSVTVYCQGSPEAGQALSDIDVDTSGKGGGQIGMWPSLDSVQIIDCTLSLQKGTGRTLSVGDIVKAKIILESTDPENVKSVCDFVREYRP